MGQLVELKHPLAAHHVSVMRDVSTPAWLFRQQVHRAAALLAFAATEDLPLRPRTVVTPLATTTGQQLASRIALVPILRAGLGLVEPLQSLLPEAEVWHLGMYRDEATARPVEYYCRLPDGDPCDVGFVLDPMLATGGSLVSAIEALQRWGCPDIRVLSVIASQPGVDRLQREFPNLKLYVCAVDPELDNNNFIIPGLGDAGDRIFNTR
ncbi:MAG: uracil phosphoribosyltransferase [Pirellulaceae bacterium]|nr:uracil phosphoribosyltransferase [Pirellulaceae bacterium]